MLPLLKDETLNHIESENKSKRSPNHIESESENVSERYLRTNAKTGKVILYTIEVRLYEEQLSK